MVLCVCVWFFKRLFFARLCFCLLPSHPQSPLSFLCLELIQQLTRRQIASESLQLPYFNPTVTIEFIEICKKSPTQNHNIPNKQAKPLVLFLILKLITYCRSLRSVRSRILWYSTAETSLAWLWAPQQIQENRSVCKLRAEPQPLLFSPQLPIKSSGPTLILHRSTQQMGNIVQLNMTLCSGDNSMSYINTLQTLHLAKVSDRRAPNISCSNLLFLWKSPILPFTLKGAQPRPAYGLCVSNYHLSSWTSKSIYPLLCIRKSRNVNFQAIPPHTNRASSFFSIRL